MTDEIEAQKKRYAEITKQREKLEADIEKAQQPLLKNRFHPDRRTKIVPELNKLKEQVGPLAKEQSALARALSGKL